MLTLSRVTAMMKGTTTTTSRVVVTAVNGNRGSNGFLPVWNNTNDTNNNQMDPLRLLNTLSPVRSPGRETDQCVVENLYHLLLPADIHTSESHHFILFFTSFTTINDFSRLIHSAKLLAIPLMGSSCISMHLDTTALTTTSLSLTPSIRCLRCSIIPSSVRSVLQQTLASLLQLQRHVPLSLHFGRYIIPCTARRSYFHIPTRCCAMEDFNTSKVNTEEFRIDVDENDTLVFCGRSVCSSQFERERWTSKEVVLTVDSIISNQEMSDDILYGDGWILQPQETKHHERSPEEWLYHLSQEVQNDLLILTTQQPQLDSPHQLALPSSTFVGFFLKPTQLYIRRLIPPELWIEQGESLGSNNMRYRLDTALTVELKKTADTLRANGTNLSWKKPIGVCRMLTQLKLNHEFTLHLEKSQSQTKRNGAFPLHSHHR
ncbi:uncharacterized protein TM35_000131100 [Trypanosoma theileri]|uniref:DUF7163 domain-containing protein n=1 Tax=Trypanosoma theileri TaxID=67003 RepID=A0A1X0NWK8_9TRYP|nr:uncharacterized protein TM35_000131100 [Trypanosoma theileri]ORC89106.1 hypothetical protein TM35_000131100 [Trypanosoma theileri]